MAMTPRHQRTPKFNPWLADKDFKERSYGIEYEVAPNDKMTSQEHCVDLTMWHKYAQVLKNN
jgi:hypothetical protein